MTKKAMILTWDQFQDHETVYPYYRLQEAGFEVDVFANQLGRIHGILGVHVDCTKLVSDLNDPKSLINI
jgi:protease I